MCAVRMVVVDIKTREILQRIYVTLRGTEQMALLGPGRVPNPTSGLRGCICGDPCSRDGQQQAGPSPELCCVTRDSPEPALRARALSGPEGMGHLACMWLNHPKLAVGRTLSAACFS